MAGIAGYLLKPFDDKSIKATRLEWERQLQAKRDDLLASDFLKAIDWVEGHMDYGNGGDEGLVYGVFFDGRSYADATVDVVYTRKGAKWLKMLGVTLSPELYLLLSGGTPIMETTKITNIYGAAVTGTLKLTGVHPSNTVKLYGRTGTLLAFLKGMAAYLQEHLKVPGVKVSIEGNWLVFRNKT